MKAIAITLGPTQLANAEMYINSFIADKKVAACIPLTFVNDDKTTSVKFLFIVED